MPSPFPGMDPYLEGPRWMGFHHQLVSEIARQLAPKLRPKYVALTTERVVIETPETAGAGSEARYPDVSVTPSGLGGQVSAEAAVTRAPVELLTVAPEAVPHGSLEIRDAGSESLVTAIEVLSPSNKRGEGRDEYLERRGRFLRSTAHLVEIDLLRTGHRVPMRQPLPQGDYFVLVGRRERRPLTEVWPIQLGQRLPEVPVPLLEGDADVELDLQGAFNAVYDAVGYDLLLKYDHPPQVPLTPQQRAWAETILAKRP